MSAPSSSAERSFPSRRREAAVAGVAGTGALALLGGIAHALSESVPFLPVAIAQSLVRTTPGRFDSFFIDRLGHWAQRLALAGTAAGFLVGGALLGLAMAVLVRRLRWRVEAAGAVVFGAAWIAALLAYPHPGPPALSPWPFGLVSLPLYLAGGLAAAATLRRLAPEAAAPPAGAPAPAAPRDADRTRRVLVASLGVGGAGLLLGMTNLSRLFARGPDPGDQRLALPGIRSAAPRARIPGDAAFDAVAGLTPEVTPLADFYVVDEELIDPAIDPATWRLAVGGLVERPMQLGYQGIRSLPVVERYQTLECISNPVGGDLISTAKWAGVPLKLILEQAGVRPGAVEVVFRAAGGYSDSLPIDHAMDPSTLIAIGMNDHVLSRAHGFPARLLSVGTYGMKNPKWLTSIEVVDRPYEGFWEQRGWSKPARIRPTSRIDTPRAGARTGESVLLAGVAFGGDLGIRTVEVSTDGGATWAPARLRSELSPDSWRQWLYRWERPAPREHRVLVRAVDGSGAVQIRRASDPFPAGATGYDSITLVT